jgi:hypothetical protein
MNEEQWLSCTNPRLMLDALRASGKGGARRLRLFGCACVRRVWDLVADVRSWYAVDAAERIADSEPVPGGKARTDALEAAAAARAAGDVAAAAAATAAAAVVQMDPWWVVGMFLAEEEVAAVEAASAATVAIKCAARASGAGGRSATRGERAAQCQLLRCVFGNPFGAHPVVQPSVLEWQAGTVPRLAAAAYRERSLPDGMLDPARLAVLADALEDAGCQDAEILTHLRGAGPHVRGCHVVDLLLGRS